MKMNRWMIRISTLMIVLIMALTSLAQAAGVYPATGFTTAALRLRKGAGSTYGVILTIPRGAAIKVTGEKNGFYAVTYNGTSGYASKDYITLSVSAEVTADTSSTTSLIAANEFYSEINSSSTASAVKALQQALSELGFYSGTIDGKWGNGTRSAVSAFQTKNSLTVTGTADAVTLTVLFDGKPLNNKGKAATVSYLAPFTGVSISQGKKGDAVAALQKRLKELGYYSGTADGSCGSVTVTAIKKFQKKMGLTQTGIADATLQALLYSSSALSATSTAAPAVTAAPENTASYPYTTHVTASVNMRKGKGTSYSRITTIPSGASISVLKADGDYLQVKYNGYTGYVPAQYVNIPAEYMSGTVLPTNYSATLNYTVLDSSSTGNAVSALQKALKELGFYTGTVDGQLGSGTLAAVKAFQKANGLRQDGIVTCELQQYIFESKVKNASGKNVTVSILPPWDGISMESGDNGWQVKQLQQNLNTLGYYTGTYSETYDNATVKAVKAFQRANGLTVDGKAGQKTLSSIKSALKAYESTTPTPQVTAAPTATAVPTASSINIREGSSGVSAMTLEARLIALGYLTGEADGVIDANDAAAIKAFQKKNGLTADGIAGYNTQMKLYSASAVTAAPTQTKTAATATPTPKVTAVPTASSLLKVGSSGSAVKTLQEKLISLGYLSGTADGVYGNATAAAVKAFQKANGLTQDGQAGTATQKLLYSSSAKATTSPTKAAATATPAPTVLKLGATGDAVKAVQQRLITLGYLDSTADGSFGYKTYSAVVNFQKSNGLTADGIVGSTTLNKLNSSSAKKASGTQVTVTPTPSATFTAPKASQVQNVNWYTTIRAKAKQMPDVVIYDPDTGLHFNLHMFSLGKHADSETPTAADTAILYQVCGYNSWTPHVVWVIYPDGNVYIASIHSHGHEVDHTAGNDMEGHICLHYPRVMSEAEATGPYAVSHQNAILLGWEKVQAMVQ